MAFPGGASGPPRTPVGAAPARTPLRFPGGLRLPGPPREGSTQGDPPRGIPPGRSPQGDPPEDPPEDPPLNFVRQFKNGSAIKKMTDGILAILSSRLQLPRIVFVTTE